MNKIITLIVLAALTTTAHAAEKSKNVGISVSLDNTLGVQAEFNIQQPFSAQVFYKTNTGGFYGSPFSFKNTNYSAIGVAGIYDLSKIANIPNPQIHPYAGVGLYTVSSGHSSTGAAVSPPVNGGIYLVAGAKYEFSPELNFDANINILSGLTIGANLKF